MVIKSPFRDYYDYVAYQYGGGDPKVVYVRNRIAPPKKFDGNIIESNVVVEMNGRFPIYYLRDLVRFEDYDKRRVAYLVVAGKAYLLLKETDLDNEDVNTFHIQPINALDEIMKLHSDWWFKKHEKGELGKEYHFLVELSKKVKSPVFVIRSVESWFSSDNLKIEIAGQCPILKDIGMPSMISATQMYQELSYFVGNTMKDHPDTEPPIEVSNSCKIVNAGFDLKQSFRHRME